MLNPSFLEIRESIIMSAFRTSGILLLFSHVGPDMTAAFAPHHSQTHAMIIYGDFDFSFLPVFSNGQALRINIKQFKKT
jgi:hypothetical protein